MGYYGVFLGLRYQTSQSLIDRLDHEDYQGYEQVTIRVPVAIPYAMDAEEYQRVDGEFEYHGEVYRLVKQRLHSDTLHIICVKDHNSKRIGQALADYVKTFTDRPANTGSRIFQNLIKDFLPASLRIETGNPGWSFTLPFVIAASDW